MNPLSEEDKARQIQRVKNLIKAEYPNAKVDNMVIRFSKKRPMDIVLLGPKGGETKIVLDNGSGLQKSFLNLPSVKKALGPPAKQIITQTSVDIIKRQKELEKERADSLTQQKNLRSKSEEILGITQRVEKEKAEIDQLKENQGPDYEKEIKRKEQLLKNLKKDLKTKQKEREELQKNQKIKKKRKRRSTNFNQAFLKKKEKEMRLKKIFTA